MLVTIILICYFVPVAVTDAIKKKLPVILLAAGLIPVSAGILTGMLGPGEEGFKHVLLSNGIGMLFGAAFLIVSFATGEKLGKADAILFCICGGAVGYEKLVIIIISAFLLGALYAAAMLAMGRLTRKSSFAFAPFILLGCIMAEVLMYAG